MIKPIDASLRAAVILADFGTSYTKWTLLIFGDGGKCELLPTVTEAAENERPLADGGCEWNPRKFLERMVRVVLDASLVANKQGCVVRGICSTGTTTSTVAIRGRNFVPEMPAVRWDDQRATVEAATLENIRGDYGASPWQSIGADSALARALWLTSRYGERLTKDTCFIEQIDLVSLFWTGRRALSGTIASRKWGFSDRVRWPAEFEAAVDRLMGGHLDVLRPKHLVEAASVVGPILPSAVDIYGLSPLTCVVAAPYDTVAQVLGLGLLHEDGAAAVSLGTSMGVFALLRSTDEVAYTRYGPIPDMPFRGQGLLYDGLRSCGSAIDLVCAMALGPRTDKDSYFDKVSQCLRETKPGSDGVSVLPYFSGGLRSGVGGVPVIRGFRDTKQTHLVRAVFEAIAYHIRLVVEGFERSTGIRLDRILAGGGPSKNLDFMQIVADVVGKEIRVANYPDAGLMGCAICAASGLKWFATPEDASRALISDSRTILPQPQVVGQYDELYASYRKEFLANEDY